MDPLSVASSVTGLLAVTGKVIRVLGSISDAPRLARSVVAETEALAAVFSQLSGFLRNAQQRNRDRMSMTTVDQFVSLLAQCVFTFSELEQELDGLWVPEQDGEGINMWNRLKWTAREPFVRDILAELQQQKLSLSLMVGLWSCKTHMEAMDKYEQLSAALKNSSSSRAPSCRQSLQSESSRRRDTLFLAPLARARRSFSLRSFDSRSRRSSVMSVMTVDQVEDISALPVPVHRSEIYNKGAYVFVSEFPVSSSTRRSRKRPASAMFSSQHSIIQRTLVTKFSALWRERTSSPRPSINISGPYDARHTTHLGVDPMTGKMQVLGEETPETITARKIGWMD